ncbi:MAG: TolC family protein [Chloroherpetonaceae bacterium]|nr:TolC family protein [Chthonomonadaceae bacterium]MDW8206555.1 TolC family protein [Chloroherpetonaceae bacterium]
MMARLAQWMIPLSVTTLLCTVPSAGHAESPVLTLEQSIALALQQNPQQRAARFARDAAQAQIDREKPVFRPTITAVASGTFQGSRVTFPRPDGPEATFLPEEFYQLHLTVEQPLYRPGLRAARQRYTAQTQALSFDLARARAELARTVRKAYLDVLRAEAAVRTAQEGLDFAERYRVLVNRQIEAGIARPVDAQAAAAQVAEARAGLTQAQSGLHIARMNFNREIGSPLPAPVALQPIDPLPSLTEPTEDAIATALRTRPELCQLEHSLVAAKAGVSLARTQSHPALHARGQFIEQTRTALLPQTYAAATLEVRWPLHDGGRARSDTLAAQAQVSRLEALLEEARQGVTLEIRVAWERVREARDRIALAREQVNAAKAALIVAEKAYEVGRGTLIEVQRTHREVRIAEGREQQAHFDLLAAETDYLYALGLLLPAHSPSQPPPAAGSRP